MNQYRIKSQQHQPLLTVKSFDFLKTVLPSKLLIYTDRDSGEESGNSSNSTTNMSCRQRAEAFARRLQFRLRSLGSQEPSSADQTPSSNQALAEDESSNQQSSLASSIILTTTTTTTMHQQVHSTNGDDILPDDNTTDITMKNFTNKSIQIDGGKVIPRRNSTDMECAPQTYFDIALDGDSDEDVDNDDNNDDDDCNGVSDDGDGAGPARQINGLVIDENPAVRTISGESLSSSDCQFFDPETASLDYYDCYGDENVSSSNDTNHTTSDGFYENSSLSISSDSCSESLPNSQSTTTFTANNTSSSTSNNTLQDEILSDLCALSKESDNTINICDCPDETDETDSSINRLQHKNQLKIIPQPSEEEINSVTDNNRRSDEDDFECKPQRVRRCSSLKTGKTPPGTPGHKKFVRFADVLGLDLADVKTFLDEIPTIPQSAYNDLDISHNPDDDLDDIDGPSVIDYRGLYTSSSSNSISNSTGGPIIDKILVPLFQQPGGAPGFLNFVREQNVCLENAIITDPICLTISGTIRVRNLDFNKSVHVRYTLNGWHSYSDLQANYIENSCDGFSDKFSFMIFGNSLQIGQRIEMAVRFSCKGDQYWDSNFGTNYCFQCLPTTSFGALCAAGNRELTNPTTLITTNSNSSNSTQIIITENSSLSLSASSSSSSATTSSILVRNSGQMQGYPAGLGDDSGSGATDSHKFY